MGSAVDYFRIAKMVNLALLTLLSMSARIVKVLQMPQEVEFFQATGLNETVLVLFGVAQVAGGVLIALRITRRPGAITVAVTLGLSTILIFANGMIAFGCFSLLPVLMAGVAVRERDW